MGVKKRKTKTEFIYPDEIVAIRRSAPDVVHKYDLVVNEKPSGALESINIRHTRISVKKNRKTLTSDQAAYFLGLSRRSFNRLKDRWKMKPDPNPYDNNKKYYRIERLLKYAKKNNWNKGLISKYI